MTVVARSIHRDWTLSRLSSIASIKRGRFSPRPRNDPKYYGGQFPFVQTGDVSNSDGRVKTYTQTLNEQGLKVSRLFPKGTILMTIAANIGHVAILDFDMACPDSLVGIAPSKNTDAQFLLYYLRSIQRQIEYTAPGAQKNVNLEFLEDLKIILPPIVEQKAIANLLSTWDRAIDLTTRLIAQKELQKKWLMQQLLTGRKRLKGIQGEWMKRSYGDLLLVVKRSVDWDDNTLYHLISVRRRSGGVFERESLYGRQILVKDLRVAKEGDFLFSKMQIVHGASALVTRNFDGSMISGSYIAVVARDEKVLNMDFFNWYSRLPYFYHQTYISSYGVHIEKMTFDFESFLTLDMKLPSLEEQKAIVRTLSTSESELIVLARKLEKLKEQKKGLMQVLLTGKIRLR